MPSKKRSVSAKPAAGGKSLVIVESPTKQKTIAKILGAEYTVKSSFGHVRDLPAKDLGVDEKKDFSPTYIVIPKAKANITDIKKSAASAGKIFLATDPDREGESIAWHLEQVLEPEPGRVSRITFHEITRDAVLRSLESARQIDMNLVEAQQARRVLDRLVGYKLSPLLWRKIGKGLSAGRVQSVAVRILTERAREIENFKSQQYWSLTVKLSKSGAPAFEAKVVKWLGEEVEKTTVHKLFADDYTVKTTIFSASEALAPVTAVLRGGPILAEKIDTKTTSQRPRPPFITSSLQQDAYTKLGFSSQRTMMVAQSLYEGVSLDGDTVGLITYMRTDSFNVSKEIQAETAKYVAETYGSGYVPPKPPVYAAKVKGAQEAHEAIHPTLVARTPESLKKHLTPDQHKLYTLIWLRFVASQMADAAFDSVSIDISAGPAKECRLKASGRKIRFDGYLKLYSEDSSESEADALYSALDGLKEGDPLTLADVMPKEHESSAPPEYNEASLIKALEKHGIGRPSTYAPIIKTILDRRYALRQQKTRKLTATGLGMTVTERLKGFFPEIMELSYTAGIEEQLDKVAEGDMPWASLVKDFYKPFSEDLAKAYKTMEAPAPKPSDEKCPVCGGAMVVRESRFGPYISCEKFPKCKGKIRLDSEGRKLEPEKTTEVCSLCGKPMVIRTGRRGRFMACSGYPACKNTCSIDAEGNKIASFAPITTERKCEKCASPFLLRKGARGYFLACSGYPKCRNITKVSESEIQEILAKSGVQQPPKPENPEPA